MIPKLLYKVYFVDHIGPFLKSDAGHLHILRIIEAVSNTTWLIATCEKDLPTVVQILTERILGQHGCWNVLRGDNAFNAGEILEMATQLCFSMIAGLPGNPTSQWVIERWNREEILQLIICCAGSTAKKKQWNRQLPFIECLHNATPLHRNDNRSPHSIAHSGVEIQLPHAQGFQNLVTKPTSN